MAKREKVIAATQCPHCGGWMQFKVYGYENLAAVEAAAERAKQRAERMAKAAEKAEQEEVAHRIRQNVLMRTIPSTMGRKF